MNLSPQRKHFFEMMGDFYCKILANSPKYPDVVMVIKQYKLMNVRKGRLFQQNSSDDIGSLPSYKVPRIVQ